MTSNRSISGFVMVVGVAGAFGAGYLVSKAFGDGREVDKGIQGASKISSDGLSGDGGGRNVRGGKPWKEIKAELVKRWEASPSLSVDFELREETMTLLENAQVADLGVWLRELRADHDKEFDKDTSGRLREMILKVLAQRGGAAFIRSLLEDPPDGGMDDVYLSMHEWIEDDPEAALKWLDAGDFPEEVREDEELFRKCALVELAMKNPREFEARLASVDPDFRKIVLESFAFARGTPEDRDEIIKRATRSPHGESMALLGGLIEREAADDPERAITTLEELNVSAGDRAALDDVLVIRVMDGYDPGDTRQDTAGTLGSWVKRNPGRPAPVLVVESFERWSESNPDSAARWLTVQPPGTHYDSFCPIVVSQHLGDFEPDHQKIAAMAARISDPNVRKGANRRIKESWQASDADAASEWERNLPAADRERLNR